MKKSLKKLSLNKQAISRLNALGIKGGGAMSPGTDGTQENTCTIATGDEETCDPRNTNCYCDDN